MAEVTDTTGLSVSTAQGQGQAQVYKDNNADTFGMWAKNYYTQNAEKEKLAAANKREDDKAAIEDFKANYKYTAKAWAPFQQLITEKTKAVKDNLKASVLKLGGIEKMKVGSPEWIENQNLQDETTALAAKTMDWKNTYDGAYKSITEDKTGEMDIDGQLKELMEMQSKDYKDIKDFDINKIADTQTGDRHIKLDGVFENGMKTVQEIMTADLKEIPDGAYKTKLIEQKKKISPFLKTKTDATGNVVLDTDPITGKPQIDKENPAFMDWVESQPRAVKSLNYKIQQAANAGELDLNNKEAVAKFRKETAAKYALNLQKNDVSSSVKTSKDNTETEGQKLARQQAAAQFKQKMDWEKAQVANKGEGTAPPSVAAINDLAKLMNKDSDRFTSSEVIGGREYRVADASNVFGGKLEKTTGTAEGRKLQKILIDVETGQLKYVDSGDPTNPKDLAENDFALLDNLLLSNLDKSERQAAIKWLENYSIPDGKGGKISAYDKTTGKMNFSVLKDTSVGQKETGRDNQMFEATKKDIATSYTKKSNKDFVADTKRLFENYKGKADLEYDGQTYTDVEIAYEGDVEGAGDDIRLYGKDKNGKKVEIGTNAFKDITQEDIPKIFENFKYKGGQTTKQDKEVPKAQPKGQNKGKV